MKIYTDLINTSQALPKDVFKEMLTFYIKSNHYKKIKEMLMTPEWDRSYLHVALHDAIYYKKSGIKIFNLLLQNVEYKVFLEVDVTLKKIKEYHLKEIIKNCFYHNKTHFIDSILLNCDSAELASCAIDISLKLKNQDYAMDVLSKYPYETTKNHFIECAIKYKCDRAVYFFHDKYKIFDTFSNFFYEKYPNQPEKHYYQSTHRLVGLSQFNLDEIIGSKLNASNAYEFIYLLIKSKDYKHIEKWIEKSRDFTQIERYKNYDINDFSMKQLIYFKKFHDAIHKPCASILQSGIEKKIIQALKHGKIDYALRVKEIFQLPSVIFYSDTEDFYFSNYHLIKKIPTQELAGLDLNERVRICSENIDNSSIFEILKDYGWDEIEQKLQASSKYNLKSIFFNHYMNLNLTNKEIKRKIKI